MRIEGKDATTEGYTKVSGTGNQGAKKLSDKQMQKAEYEIDDSRFSHLSQFEKTGLSISDKYIMSAIERANKAINTSGRTFEYRIHEKTHEIMVKVLDSETKEVIREIPSEKVLDMVAKMMEMAGIIVDERR